MCQHFFSRHTQFLYYNPSINQNNISPLQPLQPLPHSRPLTISVVSVRDLTLVTLCRLRGSCGPHFHAGRVEQYWRGRLPEDASLRRQSRARHAHRHGPRAHRSTVVQHRGVRAHTAQRLLAQGAGVGRYYLDAVHLRHDKPRRRLLVSVPVTTLSLSFCLFVF